ncbi:MAG: Gfo/Idh/MocA family oxidoreductase [Alphaproteobacteria bacterium]|nr:Gfo/Idh/MocA family oxidoreductase [Alphaproteobacteria bacterium]
MNICMVGHGMMGDWHTTSLKETDCQLHTLVGRRPEPTSQFAKLHGYKHWTTDFDQAMNDPEIDIVIIAGPSETHAPMARKAIECQKHVLVEIPIAMSSQDARDLEREAKKRQLCLGVVHPMRHRKEHIDLLERVNSGTERVRHVHSRIFMHRLENIGGTGYHRSWTDNLLWHHGAHLVDVGLWLTGTNSTTEIQNISQHVSAPDPHTGIPMDISILIETQRDQSILCTGSYYSKQNMHDILVVTDQDTYFLDIKASTFTTSAGTHSIASEQDNNAQVVKDFLNAIKTNQAPLVSGTTVLPAMSLLQHVENASKQTPKQLQILD